MMSISDPGWSRPNWAGSWYFITICPNLLSFSCLISLSFAHLLSFACLNPLSFAHFIGLSCSLFYIVSFIIVIYVPWSYQYNIDTQHLSSIIAITRLPVAVSLLIMACWSWIQAFWRNATVTLREHNSLGFFLWWSQIVLTKSQTMPMSRRIQSSNPRTDSSPMIGSVWSNERYVLDRGYRRNTLIKRQWQALPPLILVGCHVMSSYFKSSLSPTDVPFRDLTWQSWSDLIFYIHAKQDKCSILNDQRNYF